MNRSDLITLLAERFDQLMLRDVKTAVEQMSDAMGDALTHGRRIEIRGFGSFTINVRPQRMGRNPRTGEQVFIAEQRVPHFKPGKALRDAVQSARPAAMGSGTTTRTTAKRGSTGG